MIIEATNISRCYAAKAQSMGANFESHIIDFKDMPMGSIHFLWSGIVGTIDCEFKIYASNIPDINAFDVNGTEIDCAGFIPHSANGSKIWIRDRLSFRYLLVRFTKNSVSAGSVDIVALGKKS